MARFLLDFDLWCKEATKKIKYRPDRQAVYEELYLHLQDRYEDFREQDMEHEAAVQKTLQAMGDAKELAPMLAAIHRPFWGYMYSLCKWVFFLALLFMLVKFVPWLVNLDFLFYPTSNTPYDVYEDSYYEYEAAKRERIFYDEPDIRASSDGYAFSIKRVALWQETPKPPYTASPHFNGHTLRIEMEVTNLHPWEPHIDRDALNCFHAEDSLGNYYNSYSEHYYSDAPTIAGNSRQTGFFTYTYDIFTWNYVSQDAEWIELHYDRSGKDITLRIDLTGGKHYED